MIKLQADLPLKIHGVIFLAAPFVTQNTTALVVELLLQAELFLLGK